MSSPFKGAQGLRRLINAFGYSRDGFAAAWKHEAAFRGQVRAGKNHLPAGEVFAYDRKNVEVVGGMDETEIGLRAADRENVHIPAKRQRVVAGLEILL